MTFILLNDLCYNKVIIIDKGLFFVNALAFGEVLWDVYPEERCLGGATMNFAAHFKKCGGKAWIVTSVGEDLLGKEVVDRILELGIETEYVTYAKNKETGKCLITLDKNKIPSYELLNNVAYDEIKKPKLGDKIFDVLYFGTLALRNEKNLSVLKQIISENKFNDFFVDVNIRSPYYCEDVIRFALENATVVKISDEELPVVMNALGKNYKINEECAQLLSKDFDNLKIILITKGDKGSFAYDTVNKKIFECQPPQVDVVSTVGAGDSFSAAFAAQYLKTKDIPTALSLATKLSAFVVSCKDAIPEYELSDFE